MAERELPVKLYVAGDRGTVAAPVPGFSPEDIEVEVRADGRLVLDGVLCDLPDCGEIKSAGKQVLLDEWDLGPRHREIVLPAPVDAGGERSPWATAFSSCRCRSRASSVRAASVSTRSARDAAWAASRTPCASPRDS